MSPSATALNAYKNFIDDLVSRAKEMGGGLRLLKRGNLILESKDDEKAFNELLAGLSPDQRDLMVRVLQEERFDAFHDVLAALTDCIAHSDGSLTFHGEPMKPFAGGLHHDFVGRFQGDWEWPKQCKKPFREKVPINAPNLKYDHLFVVLRYEPYPIPKVKPEWMSDDEWILIQDNRDKKSEHDILNSIAGIKAFCTQEEAGQECERLNNLHRNRLEQLATEHPEYLDDPGFYFVKLVRIDKGLVMKEDNL